MQGIWLISFCNKQNNSKNWNCFLLQNYFVFVFLLTQKIQCGSYFEKVQWFPMCPNQIGWNPFIWSLRHHWGVHCPKTSSEAVSVPSSQNIKFCSLPQSRGWSQDMVTGNLGKYKLCCYLKNTADLWWLRTLPIKLKKHKDVSSYLRYLWECGDL